MLYTILSEQVCQTDENVQIEFSQYIVLSCFLNREVLKVMKREWFIMGDSFSTYAGYNPDGYRSFYGDERVEAPIVGGVEKTWWKCWRKRQTAILQ